MTCGSKGEYPGRKTSVPQMGCKDNRVKGRVSEEPSKGPECEIRRKQDEASDPIDAGCLLLVRETVA